MVSNTRRSALQAVGLVAVSLAGCAGRTEQNTETGGSQPSFDGWFEGVDNYDGVTDATDQETVTVEVGVDNGGQPYGYGPAAVRVSPETTVRWEWTGKGGAHNVKADDGGYESELVSDDGHTFTNTFTESGTSKYLCSPHTQFGMKGAVIVE